MASYITGSTVNLAMTCCLKTPNQDFTLRWRHNERDGVSNHQPRDCLLNRLFRRRSKKTSKLRVAVLCVGNSPVTGEFTSVSIVCSTISTAPDQRKYQSSASLAFVRSPVNSPHKRPVTRKMLPFDDVIMMMETLKASEPSFYKHTDVWQTYMSAICPSVCSQCTHRDWQPTMCTASFKWFIFYALHALAAFI